MSGKSVTRAEFVRNLCEMVKNGANIKFFTPETPKNWPKTHNPAQDIKDSGE
jgi:hypothetical protein